MSWKVQFLKLDRTCSNSNLIQILVRTGYSRIPIYDGERSNIVSLLFTKDMVFVDPDDKIPLKTLAQFYNNPCFYVFSDTTLDVVFKEFKECMMGRNDVSNCVKI